MTGNLLRNRAILALAVLGWLLPILGLAWIVTTPGNGLPGVPTDTQISWTHLNSDGGVETLPAVANLIVGTSPTAVAPGWSGTVTSITSVGTKAIPGTVILSIDGVQRRLCVASAPLYRPLELGDTGPDVQTLRQCVAEILGEANPENAGSDIVDSQLSQSIQSVASVIGVGTSSVFEPSWVLWSPQGDWTVSQVNATIGELAPAQGTTVVVGAPRILDTTVSVTNDNGSILSTAAASHSRLTFEARGKTVDVSPQGTISARTVNAVLATWYQPSQSGPSTGSLSVQGVLTVYSKSALQAPASAIFVGATGQTCLVVRTASGAFVVRHVLTAASNIETMSVQGSGLSQSTSVVLDPNDLTPPPRCK